MRQATLLTAAALFLLIAGSASAEYYPPSPAQDYDTSLYQSPGGLGRSASSPKGAPRVYGYRAPDFSVPYPRSCRNHRHWSGEHCVNDPRK